MRKGLITQHYLVCDTKDTLTSVIGKIDTTGITDVVCYQGKRFVGMLDIHLLLKIHTTKEATLKHGVRAVKKLKPSDDESKVVRDLLDNHTHSLPVFEKGKLLGIVRAIDLADTLISGKLARATITDHVSLRPLYFLDRTPILQALPLLRLHHVDHAPIVDSHLRLFGVLSITDLFLRFMKYPQQRAGGKSIRRPTSRTNNKRPSGNVTVGSICTSVVATGKLTDTYRKVCDTMKRRRISSVILTENETLAGIITISDLLRAVLQQ